MFHLKGNTIPGTESTLAEGKEKLRSVVNKFKVDITIIKGGYYERKIS